MRKISKGATMCWVALIVLIVASFIIFKATRPPAPPAPRPAVYYDKVEIFDAQGKSAFRWRGVRGQMATIGTKRPKKPQRL